MSAAVLQFNSYVTNSHIKQSHLHISKAPSDYINTPFTKESYDILIDLLSKEHPFKAVRLATQINKTNGFDLIPYSIIKKWKSMIGKGSTMNQLERGYMQLLKDNN